MSKEGIERKDPSSKPQNHPCRPFPDLMNSYIISKTKQKTGKTRLPSIPLLAPPFHFSFPKSRSEQTYFFSFSLSSKHTQIAASIARSTPAATVT